MAVINVGRDIVLKPGGKADVTFWDTREPGRQYTVEDVDANASSIVAACQAVARRRKAAGQDYPGLPTLGPTFPIDV